GEIVGVAGLVGAGRSELLQALFGVHPALAGVIRIDGEAVRLRRPIDAIRAGLALVPEDRKDQGLILEMAVRHNIRLAALARHQLGVGFLNHDRERSDAREMIHKLRIRPPDPNQTVQNLSGGNQQKTVLAKWLLLRPRVLLLDEPTRGVDIGARDEIYHLIEQTAAAGPPGLLAASERAGGLGPPRPRPTN